MDEELIGQLREFGGGMVATCDLCGLPRSETSLVMVSGRRAADEPVEQIRACPSCRRLIEADELPVDVVIDSRNPATNTE